LKAGDERPDFSGLFVAHGSDGVSAMQARRFASDDRFPNYLTLASWQ
jgi:hypothetical protein